MNETQALSASSTSFQVAMLLTNFPFGQIKEVSEAERETATIVTAGLGVFCRADAPGEEMQA